MGTTHDYLERCDRLAVMGGSFDPIHNGHIAVAHAVLQSFKPRRVLFLPCGQSPLKSPSTDGEHRFKMTLSAVCHVPEFDVSRMEISRKGYSYTVDTILELRQICPPLAKIYFIVGADAVLDILKWRGVDEIFKNCELIVVYRPGYEVDDKFAEELSNRGAIMHMLEGLKLEISSTFVRESLAEGKAVGGLVPPSVEEYANRLYAKVPNFEHAKDVLQSRLSPKRFMHTLGTIIEAEKLARHYGADIEKARWAALLHDCAKEYSAEKKRAACALWGISLDEILSKDIDITHSLLGAESARRDYHINDDEIYQAIAYHTTGHKHMTLLDKIILLADFIEPYREDYPPLEEMRIHAYSDINKALLIGMKDTIHELEKRGKPIHKWSKAALDTLKNHAKRGINYE
ncbi:MAG: nicotinate-nucleotide adenylyltransferase [Defluviitaleaceae bacterium]|nr:nicotinate-nucleotide adenylyltransferase [Defluviitaleaceae bacterium]